MHNLSTKGGFLLFILVYNVECSSIASTWSFCGGRIATSQRAFCWTWPFIENKDSSLQRGFVTSRKLRFVTSRKLGFVTSTKLGFPNEIVTLKITATRLCYKHKVWIPRFEIVTLRIYKHSAEGVSSMNHSISAWGIEFILIGIMAKISFL